ncbi:MAG: CpsD/CapB family tyrosine-protein kinase [Firmicutes bacterium]|nr:CpsD/CapB family tyrosine-protein kinase [Bacillota bacterium]
MSPVVESYRALRTNLRFLAAERPIRSVLVTSPRPQEGKTLVSGNLALTLADAGYKVVLVDGDLRRAQVHRMFGLDGRAGLTNVLAADASVGEVVREVGVPNLRVVPAGPQPPNPAELLGSMRMARVLEELALQANIVVVDSPPVLAVTDPLVLAAIVDGVLLVLKARSPYFAAEQAKARLEQVHARLLGVVLNQAPTRGRGGDYYSYSDYYGEEGRPSEGRGRRQAGERGGKGR